MGKKKKSNKLGSIIAGLIMFIVGAAIGVGTIVFLRKSEITNPIIGVIILLAVMYGMMFLHIAIHEGGHLIAGLMSGYKFSSYRIGNIMWQKEENKIKIRKFSLAGTGGQCIMTPPDIKDGKLPYVLFNLGGSIMNLIAALIGIIVCLVFPENSIVVLICGVDIIIGIGYALVNGIPLKLGTINNDGRNALDLGKDEEALYSFWLQLKVAEEQSKGTRLKDMPKEWFNMPSEKGLANGMIAAIAVSRANRILDEMKFQEAKEAIDNLLEGENGMVGVHKSLLTCDRIYLELISDNSKEVVEKLYTKEVKNTMKAMKNFPSVIRTEYAYSKIFEKDNNKATKILDKFNKCTKKYPYKGDVESESELIAVVDKIEIMS